MVFFSSPIDQEKKSVQAELPPCYNYGVFSSINCRDTNLSETRLVAGPFLKNGVFGQVVRSLGQNLVKKLAHPAGGRTDSGSFGAVFWFRNSVSKFLIFDSVNLTVVKIN